MKTKLVLWGENASNEKILIAMELLERDNKVMVYVFPLEVATEEFYQSMLDLWREGKNVVFPENHQKIERPLSISESLLPDDIKVERTDIITRAQAEWHFVVLSSKLYEMYKTELDELKEKIEKISEYDDKLWNEAKSFWTKVQDQVREQNLFKDHSNILKERTNNLFEKLKEYKKSLQNDFEVTSKEVAEKFNAEIQDVEEKLSKGIGLKPLFEKMKEIQANFYKTAMTKDDKKSVWERIDNTFKSMKERKPSGENNFNNAARLKSRYDGLIETIGKMEKSIQRDKQDLEFQEKKINTTDGQLEMQIRRAKLKMLEERIHSKDEKLQDMYKVRVELESRMAKDEAKKARDEKRTEAKEHVKQKIASEMKAAEEERETMADLLEDAANKIKESKTSKKVKKEESFFESVATTLTETYEDVVDTVKAVAEVAADKIEEVADKVEDKVETALENAEDKFEKVKDAAEDKFDDVKDAVKDKFENVKDAVESKFDDVKDVVEEKYEDIKDKFSGKDTKEEELASVDNTDTEEKQN